MHINEAYVASPQSHDPILELVRAYYDECAHLRALPGDIPEDYPQPAWERLESGDPLPVATTREGAIQALRLADHLDADFSGTMAVPMLVQSVIAFLESQER